MQGKTHWIIGVFAGLLVVEFFGAGYVAVLFAFFGSLFPDIDSATSLLGRRVPLIGRVFTHRGFFHSIIALLLFSWLILEAFGNFAGAGFLVGYLSHIILDMTTKAGVKVHPLPLKISGPLKTGGVVDSGLFIIGFICSAVLVLGLAPFV